MIIYFCKTFSNQGWQGRHTWLRSYRREAFFYGLRSIWTSECWIFCFTSGKNIIGFFRYSRRGLYLYLKRCKGYCYVCPNESFWLESSKKWQPPAQELRHSRSILYKAYYLCKNRSTISTSQVVIITAELEQSNALLRRIFVIELRLDWGNFITRSIDKVERIAAFTFVILFFIYLCGIILNNCTWTVKLAD